MKTRKEILALVIVTVLIFMQGQAEAGAFFKGKDLVPLMREYEKAKTDITAPMVTTKADTTSAVKTPGAHSSDARAYQMYILGVQDALGGMLWMSPDDVTAGQVCDIVTKYLQNHSEEWNESAAILMRKALEEVFPIPPPSIMEYPADRKAKSAK
jgi:hypothetical protein